VDLDLKYIYSNLQEKLLSNSKLYNKVGEINSNLYKMLSDEDISNINILFPTLKFSVSIYCIINNINQVPKCIECDSPVKTFYDKNKGFSKFCSIICSRKNVISKNKRIETNLKKYGVENPKQNQHIIEKTRTNNILKYGVENTSQLPEVKSKISKSLKDRYANSYADIINKRENTFVDRYGMHPNLTENVKSKKIENTIKKYGVEHTVQLESTKLKSKETLKSKYGVDHYSKTELGKSLLTLRNQEISRISNENFLKSLDGADTSILTREEISKLTGLSFSATCVKIRELGIIVKEINQDKISSIEKEVVNYISNLGITNILLNDRNILNGKELDIFLPDRGLALEIDGIYWHSEKFGKDKNYHLHKTNECNKSHIQLLHIFDTEWSDPIKQQIWKGMIKSRLGLNQKIHARKCVLKSVNINDSRDFCNINHLQGYHGGTIRLGLYFNDILTQLIIVGKSRYNKKYDLELIRAATLHGYTIVGGLSKLLSKISGTMISYADRRYSNGAGYKSIGFRELPSSPPNYFYVVNGILESRLKYQKHKLKNLIEIVDSSKSESYNMMINDYYRIWDCGNLVFTNT